MRGSRAVRAGPASAQCPRVLGDAPRLQLPHATDVPEDTEVAIDDPALLLLGAPVLRRGRQDIPFVPERRHQLLVLLASQDGQWLSRDRIASLFWPERTNADSRRNLRKVVFNTLPLPEARGVVATEHALRWPVVTDVGALRRAVHAGRLSDAVALRRGPALAGMDAPRLSGWSAWLAAERERIEALWRGAAHAHLAARLGADECIALARLLLSEDPLDEVAVGAWIEAELDAGRPVQALQLYRDFAARLASDLGVEPPLRLRALLERSRAPAGLSVAAPPSLILPAPTLPGPAGRFVGRRAELVDLAQRLAQANVRLVTVSGAGGLGKSRLARQAVEGAPQLLWVDLQDLPDAAAALVRLAGLIRLDGPDDGDLIAALARQVGTRALLVVLDNAEHLVDLPRVADRLLQACPGLRLLVTSRGRLHLAGESVLPLEGLAVPDDESRDLEAAVHFDAVQLFAVRAEVVHPGFRLVDHVDAVVDIVTDCAGMPLGIELAAAWVRLLPPQEIARELRRSIDVLERDPAQPGAPARPEHASLRVVLEQTWQHLSAAEQQAMAALSVFSGSLAAAAARAVAGVPLALLSGLTDKCLLAVGANGRFQLHPLLRSFGAERLADEPQRARTVERRHAEYFARWVAEAQRMHITDPQPLIAAIDADDSNVFAAWRHAVAHRRPDLVSALVGGLRIYHDQRGRMADGVALLQPALAMSARGSEELTALARVQHAIAALRYRRRDLDEAMRLAAAGAAIAERWGDRRTLFGCLSTQGACHSTAGRWRQAAPLFERALDIATEDGERAETARALADLGVIAKKEGRFELALERYSQALALNRELNRHDAAARCLNNLGVLHMERDDWARARDVTAQGLVLCERHGLDSLLPYLQNGLGLAHLELRDLDAAEHHIGRALQRSQATEVKSVEMLAHCLLARIATRRGRLDDARARFRSAALMARQLGLVTDLLDIALYYAEFQRDAGDRLGAARTWTMVCRHPMAEAGIRGSAARWCDELALDEAQRALLASSILPLDELIDRLLSADSIA